MMERHISHAIHTRHEDPPAKGKRVDPGERLQAFLRRQGLRSTRQRELILEVFMDMGGHPSPEELLEEVRLRDPSVGTSTIYRTLKLFTDSGIAKRQHFDDGLGRYELKAGKKQHVHVICEVCGRTLEASSASMDRAFEKLAAAHGLRLRRYRADLYGICGECARTLHNNVAPLRATHGEG